MKAHVLATVASLLIAVAVLSGCVTRSPSPFRQDTWAQGPRFRTIGMAQTLVGSKLLIDETTTNVIAKLGSPDFNEDGLQKTSGAAFISYDLENNWYLNVYLENGRVSDTEVLEP